MTMFFGMLAIGILLIAAATLYVWEMYDEKEYFLSTTVKSIVLLLTGCLLLYLTLPSLKYIVLKEYEVVSGECTVEVDASSRSSSADLWMADSDDVYTLTDLPELDAYGEAVPYFCEVTLTKDHEFEVGYKIYDRKTRKLLTTN